MACFNNYQNFRLKLTAYIDLFIFREENEDERERQKYH
jgi:hypothetical protein